MTLKLIYDFCNPFRIISKSNIKASLCGIQYAQNVLDLGCGRAVLKNFFINLGINYYGADIMSSDNVDFLISENGDLINCELQFDLIYSSDVLQHVKDKKMFFYIIDNYLKEGGHLIIDIPFIYPECDFEDYFRWTKSGIINELKSENFIVVSCLQRGGALFAIIALIFGTLKNLIVGERKKWRNNNYIWKSFLLLLVDVIFFPILFVAYIFDKIINLRGTYFGVTIFAQKEGIK